MIWIVDVTDETLLRGERVEVEASTITDAITAALTITGLQHVILASAITPAQQDIPLPDAPATE